MATGLAILLQAALARVLLRADSRFVYLLGRPLDWTCSVRSRFGLPCPGCGMSRSVVLSLHGDAGAAWQMAPGGPVAVYGLLVLAGALVILGLMQSKRGSKWDIAPLWIRRSAAIYAVSAVAVWLGGWAVSLSAALAR
jgi:hypothetical protein